MSTIEETIEVAVPVRTAYDQWTQFEEFPRFMEGVEEVRQLDDTHLHWRANVAGDTKEWDAEITEQVPERLIAWRATGGYRNAGVVHFEPVAGDRTKIHLQLDHEPEGAVEKVGDWLGLAGRRAKNDLERFREMIETRGAPTGGWEGEVHGGSTTGTTGMTEGTTGTTERSAPLVAGHPGEGEQITDPMPAQGRLDTDPDLPGRYGHDAEVHDVTEGPTPETRGALRATEGEDLGRSGLHRDVTDGPTPETREALEDDEIRRRERDDRI